MSDKMDKAIAVGAQLEAAVDESGHGARIELVALCRTPPCRR